MLEVKDINTFYGKIQVLWDVFLRVDEGKVDALVGANGAGKTTFLNTISGLIPSSSGSIEFLGKRINGLPAHSIVKLGICHVPEGRKLFSNMTVEENLKMGACPKDAWKKREETLEEIYDLFPIIRARKGQLSRTLSGGEQQLLAISRGLMSKPRLCMFDEPSYGLAPVLVAEIFRIIKSLHENGITVLLVEQNVHRTLEIADWAYVLENGRVILEGKGKELLQNDLVQKSYLGL